MNAWHLAGAVLLGIAASGCRTNLSRDLLEQELRMQEDKIYELQGLVEEYQQQLDSCQRENQSLLKERAVPASSRGSVRRQRREEHGELVVPEVEMPGGGRNESSAPPYDGPPVISPPDPDVPDGELRDEFESTKPSNAKLPSSITVPGEDHSELPRFETPVGDEEPAGDKLTGDETVTQISLNRKLTGGHNADGQPGDDGLMVVVEPLDASGELIEVPGEVSVVVLDPALEGEAARVARWDFTAEEAAGHIKRTPMGDGLHFDLRWPHGPPANRSLNLYVRFKTLEGKKLQLEKQIEVRLPGKEESDDDAPAWTKADKPAADAEASKSESSSEASAAPRAKATAIRPAPDDAASKTDRPKDDRTSRGSSPKWTPYR
jgi:hypothetical protein